jgi:hypothetical protein
MRLPWKRKSASLPRIQGEGPGKRNMFYLRENLLWFPRDMSQPASALPKAALMDRSWRKARIAARLLIRRQAHPLTTRDRKIALQLAEDPGVTNRLIGQAVSSIQARKKYGPRTVGNFSISANASR